MGNARIQAPRWLAALWLFGPYSFAVLLVVLAAAADAGAAGAAGCDLAVILFLVATQCALARDLAREERRRVPAPLVALGCAAHLALCLGCISVGAVRAMLSMSTWMISCRYRLLRAADPGDDPAAAAAAAAPAFWHRIFLMTYFCDWSTVRRLTGTTTTTTTTTHGKRRAAATAAPTPLAREAQSLALGLLGGVATAALGLYAVRDGRAAALAAGALGAPAGNLAARTVLGSLFAYGCLTAIDGVYRGSHVMAGLAVEPVMDAPWRSRSLREFWGRRWDRPMQRLLAATAFPAGRRCGGPAVGVAATFALSAAIHCMGVLASGNVSAQSGLAMAAFFAVQAVLVLAEAVWLGRRPSAGRRGFGTPTTDGIHGITGGQGVTLALVLGSAPLFVLPLLEMVG